MNINQNQRSCATQNSLIVAYLLSGQTLTSLEALNLFGCLHLASRITDLKMLGHSIKKDMIKLPSKKRVARYFMDAYNG